jgi:hypothetical protein
MLSCYIDLVTLCKHEEKQDRRYPFEDMCDGEYIVACLQGSLQ